MTPRLPLRTVVACAALLAVPAMGSAAARYAVPTGGVASGSCPAAAPCTLRFAVEGALGNRPSDGDDVHLAAGDYTLTSTLAINYRLNISGPDGVYTASTPWASIIFPSAGDGGMGDGTNKVQFTSSSAGSRLERVAVTGKAVGTQLVNAASAPNTTFERVRLYVRGSAGAGLLGSGLTLGNSLIQQTSTDTFGVGAAMTGRISGSSITSDGGIALSVLNAATLTPYCALTVADTIAVGGTRNAQVERTPPSGSMCTSVSMDIGTSWVPATGTGGGLLVLGAPNATMTQGAGNLPATAALTTDPAYGGTWWFAPTSPSVNAGCTTPCPGTDLYGRPRPIGPAGDLGAGESSLPPIVGATTASAAGTDAGAVTGTVDAAYAATTYRVEYRAQGAGTWLETAALDAGAGAGALPVAVRLDGLASSTTYVARVVATNSLGTTTGAEASFTTGAVAPAPTSGAAGSPAAAGLVAKWSRKGRTVRAVVTPLAGASAYRMSASRTKGAASTRRGRCVAVRVKGARRQRCTITLPAGKWSVTVQGRKGAVVVAAATRAYTVK